MGGFFGTICTRDCVNDLFYDTATQQHWAFLPAAKVQELMTGIMEVKREELKVDSNEVYDLQGRRVGEPTTSRQLQRGLYLINGKKILIK